MFPVPGIDGNEVCPHVSPPDHTGTKSICWRRAGHDGPHRLSPFGFEWPAGTRRVVGTRTLARETASWAVEILRRRRILGGL